jgi:hypothetical protein
MVYYFKFFLFIVFASEFALSCPACFGKNNANDESEILKMYKQKSEFYKQKYQTEVSVNTKQPECDFSKGNDNCKKVNP